MAEQQSDNVHVSPPRSVVKRRGAFMVDNVRRRFVAQEQLNDFPDNSHNKTCIYYTDRLVGHSSSGLGVPGRRARTILTSDEVYRSAEPSLESLGSEINVVRPPHGLLTRIE